MRTSAIPGQDLSRIIPLFFVIGIFVLVAVALYVAIDILPAESLSRLSYLLPVMIALTALLTWQPKLTVPLIIVSVFFSSDIVAAQIPGRNVNLRVEDGILVAALLALIIRYTAGREWFSISRTPLDKPILAYCAVGLISTLLGIYLGNVSPLRGFFFFAKRVEYFLLFYILCHCLEEEREIKIAVYLVFICALGISLYGVYMRLTSTQAQWRAFSPLGGSTRITEYAEILVLIIPIVIAVAFEKRSFTYILVAPLAIFFMSYFLMDSLRRSAIVGMWVSLLFIAVYKYQALIFILFSAVFYFIIRLPASVAERINLLWLEVTQYPYSGGSLAERVVGMKWAITYGLYRPLIGRGLGTYSLSHYVSHNQYSHMLIETGLLGLGAFIWFIVLIAKLCWNGAKVATDNLYRGFCIGFFAGILGWLVMCLGTISFTSIRTMNSFMIMTAILVACTRSAVMDKGYENED